MEGLAQAAEHLTTWLDMHHPKTFPLHILFYSDNTTALQCIFATTSGIAQNQTSQFRECILKLLDKCPACKIEMKWVPGHHKIRGNEKADALAKSGSLLPSIYPFSASSAYIHNLNNKHLLKDWQLQWVNNPSQNHPTKYSICNVNPPCL
jgi:RNase H